MVQIGSKTKNSSKLYVVMFPVGVAELHLPEGADPNNPNHNQWWSCGEPENVETKVLEIRVWASSMSGAIDKVSTSLYKLSNEIIKY